MSRSVYIVPGIIRSLNLKHNKLLASYILQSTVCKSIESCSHRKKPITESRRFIVTSSNVYSQKDPSDDGYFKKQYKKLHFLFITQDKLMINGGELYAKLDLLVDVNHFIKFFELEDSFASWYRIKVLHLWLIYVRLMSMEQDGKYIRNGMTKAFTIDTERRSKMIGIADVKMRKKQLNSLMEELPGSMVSYDSCLGGDDKILASVLWRIFFLTRMDNPEKIECLIHYIRSNLCLLDKLKFEDLMTNKQLKLAELIEIEDLRKLHPLMQ